ncbi:MAG: sugar phosphate isomerase/epimerase [Deltaproteobacteria bacterium]|nr:sugar phosphate isomerase/epimerase [Deltaproteobacteria bacterium]
MDARPLQDRLALHTWTLDTTPLGAQLRIARETGWNAVELRHIDFTRAFEAGMSNDEVVGLIRGGGMKVATLGVKYGWIFAGGEERRRLFDEFAATCANAVKLGCDLLMSAPGPTVGGTIPEAAASLREAGDVAEAYGLRLAIEFSSVHDVINRLEKAREMVALAGHSSCGLLLDAYHLERTGAGGRAFEDIPPSDIFAFHYSDCPSTHLPPGRPMDRLPPGQGVVRWHEVFGLLIEKNGSSLFHVGSLNSSFPPMR